MPNLLPIHCVTVKQVRDVCNTIKTSKPHFFVCLFICCCLFVCLFADVVLGEGCFVSVSYCFASFLVPVGKSLRAICPCGLTFTWWLKLPGPFLLCSALTVCTATSSMLLYISSTNSPNKSPFFSLPLFLSYALMIRPSFYFLLLKVLCINSVFSALCPVEINLPYMLL